MRLKDQVLIINEIEKVNKKQSRNTIIGLSISIILSIISLFAIISFYFGVIHSANESPCVSTINLHYSDYDSGNIENRYLNQINENKLIDNYIIYSEYEILFKKDIHSFSNVEYYYPTIYIDGNEISNDFNINNNRNSDAIIAYDNLNSKSYILKSEDDYLSKSNFKKSIIAGTLFEENDNEIIVSNLFLEMLNILDPSSVIGKKISYRLPLSNEVNTIHPDTESTSESIYLFKDYIIKGVFNFEIYNCPSRVMETDYFGNDKYKSPMFWVKKTSIIDTVNTSYSEDYEYDYTSDPILVLNEAANDGKIAIPFGFNTTGHSNYEKRNKVELVSFDNIINSYKFIQSLKSYIKDFEKPYAYQLNYNLDAFFVFYPFFKYISLILLASGIIFMIIAILNIYWMIQYTIKKNIYFLGLMKAIGANNKDINRLYLLRIYSQYIKAIITSLLISFIGCLVMTITLNIILNSGDFEGSIKYNISFWFYPLVFIFVVLIIGLFLLIVSKMLSKKIKKGALINILNGE